MNPSVKNLAEISGKKTRTIIGLMSGTSLDGLDIALCKISGSGEETTVSMDEFTTKPYRDYTASLLKRISSVEDVYLKDLCYTHAYLADIHSRMIIEALKEWDITPGEIDCIASHGQTIYHYPARDQAAEMRPMNSTLQIGDGDHIASKTGILTISDFRQKHIAHGGEGAPMAALVDALLFGSDKETRIMLNIGGIGNFTVLPARSEKRVHQFTTDTGPGNTLINKLAQKYFNREYDKDAEIALSGNINPVLMDALLQDPWFAEDGPKSTGPEYFNLSWIEEKADLANIELGEISSEDILATVTELSAYTIAEAISGALKDRNHVKVYVSGGGAHNPFMMQRIKVHLSGMDVEPFTNLGYNPDAKEAVIFAVLANEMLAGDGFMIEDASGSQTQVNFGKISFPT
jgi:anhydro-N-acetylmuramic acid kinase